MLSDKYHSQSHTSIVLPSKNELLNSLLSFSSGKVLLCQQTHIWVGMPVQSLCSKDDNVLAALQMAEEKFVRPRMRFWGTYDSEWVTFKWLDEMGSKF